MLINVSKQLCYYEVAFVSFCRQREVPSRTYTVLITVDVWEEPVNDMTLVVCRASEEVFVSIFCELGSNKIISAVQPSPNASMDKSAQCGVCQKLSRIPTRLARHRAAWPTQPICKVFQRFFAHAVSTNGELSRHT